MSSPRRWLALLAFLLCAALYLRAAMKPHLPARSAGTLRAAAANLYFLSKEGEAVGEVLAGLQADLLYLSELSEHNAESEVLEDAGLRPLLHDPRPSTAGSALWVREDLAGEAEFVGGVVAGTCRKDSVVGRLPELKLTVVGLHAPRPGPVCDWSNAPTLRALAALAEGGRLREDLGPGRAGDWLVVLGDLNALPWMPGQGALWLAGLRDPLAWDWRLHPTWPDRGGHVLGRLDYVRAAPELLQGGGSFPVPVSDHHGVVGDLRLP